MNKISLLLSFLILSSIALWADDTTTYAHIDLGTDASVSAATVDVADITMPDSSNVFMMSLPFPVSSYYFGADATIYNLASITPAAANNILTGTLQKVDLDAVEELPVNTPLLIISSHKEKVIQGTIDLFEEDNITVSPADYSGSIAASGVTYGTVSAKTSRYNPTSALYVMDGGVLKRVCGSAYSVAPLAVTFSNADAYKDFSLILAAGSATLYKSLVGDVNYDGAVNISDVNAIISAMCGEDTYAATADINSDCAVNISDVNKVISVICGSN